jgi:hypothetical protein
LTLPDATDVVLHDRDPAREAMLVTKPLEDPLRRVTLLLRSVLKYNKLRGSPLLPVQSAHGNYLNPSFFSAAFTITISAGGGIH